MKTERVLSIAIVSSVLAAASDLDGPSGFWDSGWNLVRLGAATLFVLSGALWVLIVSDARKTLYPVWALLASIPCLGLWGKYLVAPGFFPASNYLTAWVLMPSELLSKLIRVFPLANIGTSHVAADAFFLSWVQLIILNGVLLFGLMLALQSALQWGSKLKRGRARR